MRMSPREDTPLMEHNGANERLYTAYDDHKDVPFPPHEKTKRSFGDFTSVKYFDEKRHFKMGRPSCWMIWLAMSAVAGTVLYYIILSKRAQVFRATGPYKLVEKQTPANFFDYYNFFDGPDSIGSAGHQVYVSKERAAALDIFNVTYDENTDGGRGAAAVYMKSAPSPNGKRESIRLEGKRRFNRGLFVLDLDHMPAGAGLWPAFWMTDEAHWPDHGEIDIVENINFQTRAKTALHTSGQCRMYGQIPNHAMTGTWDRATGIPDPTTNASNFATDIEADDCWNLAAHRWYNQGCVLVEEEGTIGKPVNDRGGGVYALEWDPINGYIKSWTFTRDTLPANLELAMTETEKEIPNPSLWGTPYAYFAIGPKSDCSEDHFQNMRLVFNLAFCGEVAGNRFFKDCPDESKAFNVSNDPIKSCNAYVESEPDALDDAYWKIRGVYSWERELQLAPNLSPTEHGSFRRA